MECSFAIPNPRSPIRHDYPHAILTTGTVLMVVVVLYFAGGSGMHAFAFSMIIGALAGTYSTVFIAAPLLLWLHNRPGPAGGKVVKPVIADKPTPAAAR